MICMKIDFNETECKAMEAFSQGDFETGHILQDQFLEEVIKSLQNGEDHCPCPASCKHHGKCMI